MPFRPAAWLPGGHLQTLYSPLFRRRPRLQRDRERIALADGDFIDLDWYGEDRPGIPWVILLHGLTGSSDSLYVLGQQRALATMGWRSVAVNWRGCSGEPNHLPRGYHSGASDDLAEVLGHIRNLAGAERPLAAIGYSLGANVLLKYLGERGAASDLVAAAAVSVPFRLDECADRLGEGFSRIYQARFMREMVAYVANKQLAFAKHRREQEHARLVALGSLEGMSSFWEFDERVTAPLHGYRSAADYYRRCSSRYFLGAIVTPTLIVQSRDDPFVYPKSLPTREELPEAVTFELHARGGHVGFVEGPPWRPRFYLEERLPRWLAAQVSSSTER